MSSPRHFSFALAALLSAAAGATSPATNPFRLKASGQGEYRLAGLQATPTPRAFATPPATNPHSLKASGKGEYRLAGPQAMPTPRASATALAGKPYAREIDQAARRNRLDPALVHAVIHVESRHQAAAVSSKGAVGLMQLLPATAERFGIADPGDPAANLAAGTRYLRRLLDQFDQRLDLALAAYNAGEGAVVRHGNRIPPYRETLDYVPSVMEKYHQWLGIYPSPISYMSGTRLDPRAVAALPAD